MPHYADGTEAKIGDQVTGKLYNTVGVVAGTIVSITPAQDNCNAMVQFTKVAPLDSSGALTVEATPRMAVRDQAGPIAHIRKTRDHQTAGEPMALVICADYCAINELAKVGP